MFAHRRLLLLFALASACASPDTQPDEGAMLDLSGTRWTLTELDGQPALPNAPVTLEFEAERVAGGAGVNRYFGTWATENGRLRLSPLGVTRMAGPPDLQQQEDRFLKALQDVDAARLDGTDLVLASDREALLRFAPIDG